MASEETPDEATQGGEGEESPATEGEAAQRTLAPARLIDQLAERGFGVADHFVDDALLGELRARCLELDAGGALRAAKIGRGANERLAPEVRGDFISWVQAPERDAEQR